jgi:hypothetical protein
MLSLGINRNFSSDFLLPPDVSISWTSIGLGPRPIVSGPLSAHDLGSDQDVGRLCGKDFRNSQFKRNQLKEAWYEKQCEIVSTNNSSDWDYAANGGSDANQ